MEHESETTNLYVIEGIKETFLAFFKTWIRRGFVESPEEFIRQVQSAIGQIINVLKMYRFRKMKLERMK